MVSHWWHPLQKWAVICQPMKADAANLRDGAARVDAENNGHW
jgi:hypothetical protein